MMCIRDTLRVFSGWSPPRINVVSRLVLPWPCFCERSGAKRSEPRKGASVQVGALYREVKQLNISKTRHFWTMLHRRKNAYFHPLNPFPWWTGLTRPDPNAFWTLISLKIWVVQKNFMRHKSLQIYLKKVYQSLMSIESLVSKIQRI